MARPKNEKSGKPVRTNKLQIMLTDDEKALLEKASSNSGYPLSTYVRGAALKDAKSEKSKADN